MPSSLPDPDAFERIVFFTGAGLSAEAGIPTYRGRGGVWAEYDWESYACQRAFDDAPDRVLRFHDVRREAVATARPTRGHEIIAAVQAERPTTRVITQNIDGLHQRSGASSIVELHGSLWRVRCACHPAGAWNDELPMPHRCPDCGSWRRPDIVWFGDTLGVGTLEAAIDAMEQADLLIGIGTSGVVHPAAELPRIALTRGAESIEVNPESTPVSSLYGHHMREQASSALARLWPRHEHTGTRRGRDVERMPRMPDGRGPEAP